MYARQRLWAFFEALYSQELKTESPRATNPSWIKTPLLGHQQAALQAAHNLEKAKIEGIEVPPVPGEPAGGRFFTSHGILGDHVGSGKSLTALALAKAPAPPSEYMEYVGRGAGTYGDGRDTGLLRKRSQLTLSVSGVTLKPVSTCLFIVPHALISQWESYVEHDTTLKAKFIKRRNDATDVTFMQTIENYDAIFVSATMYNSLRTAHNISGVLWKRLFIDEADSISISTGHDELNACFYWFITASWLNLVFAYGASFNVSYSFAPLAETPAEVQARVRKMLAGGSYLTIPGVRHVNIVRRTCACLSSDGIYGAGLTAAAYQSSRLIIHSAEDFIRTSFSNPKIIRKQIVCLTPANIRVLDSFISPDMMERLNAGDVHGALEMLGMSAHTESEITEAVTASLKKDLDNAKKTYEFKKTMDYSTEQAKVKALEACEQKIASIESRISAIQDRIKKSAEQTCPICYAEVNNAAITPCCQQLFCFPCLCESLKRVAACPLCRERITDMKTIRVIGEAASKPVEPEAPANKVLHKKETFLNYVRANKKARILMFSGYDASFGSVEEEMRKEEIKFATLNGSQARINKLLREFKDGKYNVLFLNARNMGAGLNIDCATHVVLYHKMSADLEEQIVGRAVRLGRTADLEVVHLLHENEIGTVSNTAAAAAAVPGTITHV